MRQALEIALEALEKTQNEGYNLPGSAIREVITAIKEALAQPEQEPVACIGYWNQKTGAYYKPDQISAAHKKLIDDGILRRCYTTPPQRKPLTDKEIILIVAECAASHQHTDIHFARAIERAHGIKELV